MRTYVSSSGMSGERVVYKRPPWRLAAAIGVAGLAGCVLASCSKYEVVGIHPGPNPIPLPKQALLRPEPEPGCASQAAAPQTHGSDLRLSALRHASAAMLGAGAPDSPRLPATATSAQSDHTVAQADPNLALSQRIKLEFERDCFRRATIRIRERLLKLQQAVAVTARAVKRAEQSRP